MQTTLGTRHLHYLTILFCVSLFFLGLHVIDDAFTTGEPAAAGSEVRMLNVMNRFNQVDRAVVAFMGSYAISLLRIALAVTYIWFGTLKVLGVSPVAELVAKTVFFLPTKTRVLFMGIWEVLIGIGLLLRFPLRLTLLLMNLQLVGTFLVLIMQPRRAFQKMNPLLLTETGEFVIKNFVLLSAGIAVGSTVRRESERIHDERGRVTP